MEVGRLTAVDYSSATSYDVSGEIHQFRQYLYWNTLLCTAQRSFINGIITQIFPERFIVIPNPEVPLEYLDEDYFLKPTEKQ